jgi:predicted AlkP superfamily pyrophosphatase or phosphodiesterase
MTDLAFLERQLSVKDVIPSALHSLGLLQGQAPISLPDSHHVIVLLIDGLGELQLRDHLSKAPIFLSGSNSCIATEFPSTTPVVLGSLGTGLSPGEHGLVGASFWLPEEEEIFAPLRWGSTPHPLSITPERTLFEFASESGADVATIAPTKHQHSGLTRSVLRGSTYHGADSLNEILSSFGSRQLHLSPKRLTLTYVYWPDLDRIGHIFGSGSDEWIQGLRTVNSLITSLVEKLVSGESLIVTSDHGMITCPHENRLRIEDHPSLQESLLRIGGEPRVRHLYVRNGSHHDVQEAWKSVLGERAHVFTRDQSLTSGLFKVNEASMTDRIGDLVVISRGSHMISSAVDPLSSSLLGQHGSLTPEESLVPLSVFVSESTASAK